MTSSPRWRKASRSQSTASCVEVAHTLDALRDSKNVAGPVLRADARRLIAAVRSGRFGA
jgi:hypothetical protein